MTHGDLIAAVLETCRRNKLRDGYIRLVVTRGVGTLGLEPQPVQESLGDHHRGQDPALPPGALPAGHGDHHRADHAQPAQRA